MSTKLDEILSAAATKVQANAEQEQPGAAPAVAPPALPNNDWSQRKLARPAVAPPWVKKPDFNVTPEAPLARPQSQAAAPQQQPPKIEAPKIQRPGAPQESAVKRMTSGAADAFKEGLRDTTANIGITMDAWRGDTDDAMAAVNEARRTSSRTPDRQAFMAAVDDTEHDGTIWGAIKDVGGAAIEQPIGALQETVAQLPNSGTAMAGMWAGGKAGFALGAMTKNPVATAISTFVGGVAGAMFGTSLVETGGIVREKAQDGELTEAELSEATRQGATKAAVIGTVDRVTMGVTGLMFGAAGRAAEKAAVGTLQDAGVNIANREAVQLALADPGLALAVKESVEGAIRGSNTALQRTGRVAASMSLESFSEGAGEYWGSLAAGLPADLREAVMEGFLSMPQSAIETAWSRGKSKSRALENLGLDGDIARQAEIHSENMRQRDQDRQAAREMPTPPPRPAGTQPPPGAAPPPAAPPPMDAGQPPPADRIVEQEGDIVLEDDDAPAPPPTASPAGALPAAEAPAALSREERATAMRDISRQLKLTREERKAAESAGNEELAAQLDSEILAIAANFKRVTNGQAPEATPRQAESQPAAPKTWQDGPITSAQNDQPKAVLQNRNRATPASIQQMTDIAANPDYTRLGFSRDFANGAPVVEPGAEIPEQNMGRVDVATTANGRKIPVQYAVVEADQLLPSNRADGTPVAEYEQGMPGTSRAIAGNGRVAGLQRAHEQGTTADYIEGLAGDAALHGIPEQVVRGMEKPVLVRVMPQEEVTDNIGDESNTSGTAELSPAEQARNDTRRIDINAVALDDNGEPTAAAVEQFIASMPAAERASLLDGKRPNRRAYERLGNAVFAEAYQSDELLRLAAEATDAEARTIISGLKIAAGKMSRLKNTGDYDIRQLVIEAAETALNARRSGQTLTQFIEQGDMGRNPYVLPVLEMMAKNIRSAKAIGENLSNLADVFYAEASRADTDMFGDVQKRPPQQLMEEFYGSSQADAESQEAAVDQRGAGSAPRGDDGQAAVGGEPDGAVQPEGESASQADQKLAEFDLTQETEAEREAREAAEREAAQQEAAATSKADEEARREKEAAADRKRADETVDSFQLGQDADQQLSGQSGMFDNPPPQNTPPPSNDKPKSTAPEHAAVGVDDRELSQIVGQFNAAQRSMLDADEQIHHLFDPPTKNEVVRLADKVKLFHAEQGWMTPAEAKAKIQEWKDRVDQQYDNETMRGENSRKVVLSFFDLTGKWSQPWEDAGYQVWRFDIQNDPEMGDVNNFSTEFFGDWFSDFDGNDIYAILAACPCTDFASSGARHFAAKDTDGRTVASVNLVHQTLAAIEYFKPSVWAIENPVGRIEKLGGLPPWRLSFDPNHLGETYTKKTLIWGRFNADLPVAPVDPVEGSKMHSRYGGSSIATKNARSATPEGFSYGFFMANNAIDNPVMALANKFDRLDRDLIAEALTAGVTSDQITEAVEDFYYQDLDDAAANQAIRDLIEQVDPVTAAAASAATSPQNELPAPTEGQIEAGNYKKGHVSWNGLGITIENPAGTHRRPEWPELTGHYGYIKRTEGADGEHVDVFLNPAENRTDKVVVIDQYNRGKKSAGFDEHKVMLGYPNKMAATSAYKANYTPGWQVGPAVEMTMDEFKAWLRDGNTTEAAAESKPDQETGDLASELSAMSDDDLSSLFDEVAGETSPVETEKPESQRPNSATDDNGKKRPRKTRTKPESINVKNDEAVERAAGEIAKSIGVNLTSGGKNALEGLTKLFGGPGRLNSGLSFDEKTYAEAKPHFQAMLADFSAAGRDLRDLIRALIDTFGTGVRPYVMRFAKDLRAERNNVERDAVGTEPDSGNRQDAAPQPDANLSDEGRGSGRQGTDEAGQAASESGREPGPAVDLFGAPVAGERGDQSFYDEKSRLEAGAPRDTDDTGSRPDSTGGLFADRKTGAEADNLTGKTPAVIPPPADAPAKVIPGNREQVAARMPFLTAGQMDDVVFAERRLSKPDGFGVLFTNGTGTGKTFTGLGVVRRMVDSGKGRILVVVPKQTIGDAWVRAGRDFFGLEITPLESTRDVGKGVVVTTYANMGDNNDLAAEDWDGFVIDEAHYLASNQQGDYTKALDKLNALGRKSDAAGDLAKYRNQELLGKIASLEVQAKSLRLMDSDMTTADEVRIDEELKPLYAEWNEILEQTRREIAGIKDEDKPRAVFLSATPFAYEKNVRWAQEWLFNWNPSNSDENKEFRGYNSGSNYDRFMMTHFGYRLRYNKLTEPDSKVDRGLMQRTFNTWLKKEGVLSARALDSDFDYDRRFVMAESAIGKRVDDALEWLRDQATVAYEQDKNVEVQDWRKLSEAINESFDYQSRMYFLEAIKAKESIPHVRAHLDLGRKVMVVHDFKKGGTINPFKLSGLNPAMTALYDRFASEFSDLIRAFDALPSPIAQLTKAFPEALVYNGDVTAKNRVQLQNQFNSDAPGSPRLMIAQSDAIREGVSIHDTTGKHQRVEINLGMPAKPTAAIQLEGRIYRTGQASDAMFRYFTIGTNWERYAFASKIAGRTSAAENLAMGEEARGLKEAFINAYEEADTWQPGYEGEGTGGKETDKAYTSALTPWDMAKSFYFGSKKQGSGRGARGREGKDYFATPEPLGMKMVQWADLRGGESALEPSAGHGAIARWLPENTTNRAIEFDNGLASKVALHFDGQVQTGDFMEHNVVNKYDAIVMNPPFGQGGAEARDHVAKAMKHMRDGGRLVALIPTGPAADKKFEALLESEDAKDIYTAAIITLPASTFERAGTKVMTRVLVLEKQTNEELASKIQQQNRNYSDTDNIEALFERLETSELRPRVKPEPQEEAAQSGTEPASAPSSESTGGLETWTATHSQTGATLYMAKAKKKVSREEYSALASLAKRNGGYWSRFGKAGFLFKTEAERDAFVAAAGDGVNEEPALYSADDGGSGNVGTPREVQSRQRGDRKSVAGNDAGRAEGQFDLFAPPGESKQAYADLYGTVIKARPVSYLKVATDAVTTTESLAHIVASIRKDPQENFYAIATGDDGKVLRVMRYTRGTKDASAVYPLDVIAEAASVEGIRHLHYAHNHPSGGTDASPADNRITETLNRMLEGTGIEPGYHVIIGKNSYGAIQGSGALDAPIAGKINPAVRNKTVAVTERRFFKRDALAPAILDPRDAIRATAGHQDSLFLLDNQRRLAAIIKMSPEEMKTLREGGRVRRILSAFNKSNANGVIIKSDDERAANNMNRYLSTLKGGVQVLDWINGTRSMTAAGTFRPGMDDRPFYSKGAPVANGHTRDSLIQSMDRAFPGALAALENSGLARIVTSDQIPASVDPAESVSSQGRVLAYVQNGQVTFVADNIAKGHNVRGLMLHEIGVHLHQLGRDSAGFQNILRELESMRSRGDKAALDAFARVPKDTPANLVTEEALGYLVEEGRALPIIERLKAWLREQIRKWTAGAKGSTAKALSKWASELSDADLIYMATRAVKSASSPSGSPQDSQALASAARDKWYRSALADTVRGMGKIADKNGLVLPNQAKLWLQSQQKKGAYKQEEMEWSGLSEWLDMQPGKVSVESISDYMEAGGVQVEEVTLGDTASIEQAFEAEGYSLEFEDDEAVFIDPDGDGVEYADLPLELRQAVDRASKSGVEPAKYSDYQLPGGENYREALLTLPTNEKILNEVRHDPEGSNEHPWAVIVDGREVNRASSEASARVQLQEEVGLAGRRRGGIRGTYLSGHWEQPNILAHIRMNDRTDADGNKVLFIEEIQSDWAQAGRKQGFREEFTGKMPKIAARRVKVSDLPNDPSFNDDLDEMLSSRNAIRAQLNEPLLTMDDHVVLVLEDGSIVRIIDDANPEMEADKHSLAYRRMVDDARRRHEGKQKTKAPAAPFVKETKSWTALAVKRIIAMAAEGGYDKVAFIGGEQSADRYSLRKKVRSLSWRRYGNEGGKAVTIEAESGNDIEFVVWPSGSVGGFGGADIGNDLDGKTIDAVVGKEIGEKILQEQSGDLAGDGLEVGGEGMKAYYDQIVPQVLRDVLKKTGGGSVESTAIPGGYQGESGPGYRVDVDGEFQDVATLAEAREIAERTDGKITFLRGTLTQPGFTITDTMRQKVQEGLPLFSRATSPAQGQTVPPSQPERPPQQGEMGLQGGSGQPVSAWDAPEPTFMDTLIYRGQDKHIDMKRVQQMIGKTGKVIAESMNPYLKEELYHGRSATRVTEFVDDELGPLVADMRARQVSQEEIGRYLWARHAPEANAHIAKINPELPDGGSGMTNQEAADYMAGLTTEQKANYAALAARVDSMVTKTRDALVADKLISAQEREDWESAYEFYVPLMREGMDELGGMGTGQGYSVKGKESKRRTGSALPVADILGNIANARDKAIVRGEKARVGRALYALALTNPNKDFWTTDRPPMIKTVAMVDGVEQVVQRPDPMFKSRDNVVVVKVPTRNGKIVERAIIFNQRDPRAMRMANAFKNLDGQIRGELMSGAAAVTRYFSAINTQYNPIFGVINLLRDSQASIINLSTTPIAGKQAEVMRHAASIITSSMKHGMRKFGGEWATLAREFEEAGGVTGYRDMFRDGADRTAEIEKSLDPTWWTKRPWGKALTANGYIKAPMELLVDKGTRPIMAWLTDYNQVLENTMRLAVYRSARDAGHSKDAAASMAKNISTNFNRKGEMALQVGALYAFFNATVQGTVRMLETFAGPAGKQILAGGVMIGVIQAITMAAAGYDEDEPPQFVRERALIFPIPGTEGKYTSIAMPLGFHILPNMGRIMVETMLFGDPAKRTGQALAIMADAFNPLGGSAPLAQIIAPTIADPFVALGMNEDWTGKPIAREDFNKLNPTAGFTRSRDSVSAPARLLAQAINAMTGGNDYVPGFASPTGDQIEYLFGQLTGGVGREATKAATTITSMVTGEELPAYKVPLIGRFYGETKTQAAEGNRFYANLKRINRHHATIKGLREDRKGDEAFRYLRDNPEARLYDHATRAHRNIQDLRNRKRMMEERGASKAMLKKVEDQVTVEMKRLNERMATL